MKQCPRCLKNIGTANGDVHTCSPTDWARKMESRVAELEELASRLEDAMTPEQLADFNRLNP